MAISRHTLVSAIIVALLLLAAAPWLLPVDRWLPAGSPEIGQRDGALVSPLQRVASPPPLEAFSEMIERPLFAASRRAPVAAGVAGNGARLVLGRYRLSGVVVTGERRFALLVDTDGGHLRVEEGEELDGWRMEAISPRRLVLTRDGERREHSLLPPPAGHGDGDG